MVDLIRPSNLPAAPSVGTNAAIAIDTGAEVLKATPKQITDAGFPIASESQARAGVSNSVAMTPLGVRQFLDDTMAPSVLRAQAWAESAVNPDPADPSSKSAKSWAELAEAAAVVANKAPKSWSDFQLPTFMLLEDGATVSFNDLAVVRDRSANIDGLAAGAGWKPFGYYTSADQWGGGASTSQLQKGIVWAASSGKAFILPARTITVSLTGADYCLYLPSNSFIIGENRGLSRLLYAAGQTAGAVMRLSRGAKNVYVSGFTIDGNRANQTPAIGTLSSYFGFVGMRECENITFTRMNIENVFGRGLVTNQDNELMDPLTNAARGWVIDDVVMKNCGTKNIMVRRTIGAKVSNCDVETLGVPEDGVSNGDNVSAFEASHSTDVQFANARAKHLTPLWGVTCRVTNGASNVIYTNVIGEGGRQFASISGSNSRIIGGIGRDTLGILVHSDTGELNDVLLEGIVLNGVDGYGVSVSAITAADSVNRLKVVNCAFVDTNGKMQNGLRLSPASVGVTEVYQGGNSIVGATSSPILGNWLDNGDNEGVFTPTVGFSTNGDLSVTYTNRNGHFWTVGKKVFWKIDIIATVTHSTASGDLRISGLPYNADATTSARGQGNGSFRGITFANRTQFNPFNIQNSDQIGIRASGSGVDDGNVTAAQVPSGGSLRLEMSGWYIRRQ